MPNYDYECDTCGNRFEVFQSMNDAKLTACPDAECEGKVRRLLGTGGGIIFKGSGFYQTDYRSSSYNEAAKKDTSGSAEKSSGHSCGSSCGCSGGAKKESSPAKATEN
jgi:putative FmdB family regulatory protein